MELLRVRMNLRQPMFALREKLEKIALCGLLFSLAGVASEAAYAGGNPAQCGSNERNVRFTTGEATVGGLDVSPDGASLVFSLFGDIYTLPAEGGEATAITSGAGWDVYPVWAPDGKSIAFISDRDGDDQVYVVPYPTPSEARKVSSRTLYGGYSYEGVIRQVEWLPDSRSVIADGERFDVVGASVKEVPPLGWQTHTSYSSSGSALYRFEKVEDGKIDGVYEVSRITSESPMWKNAGLSVALQLGEDASPLISKDGRWLAYKHVSASKADGVERYAYEAPYPDTIRIRDLSSGQERRLAGTGSPGWTSSAGFIDPGRMAISPDSQFLYTVYGKAIHRIDIRTGQTKRLQAIITVDQCLAPMLHYQKQVAEAPLVVRNMRNITQKPGGGQFAFSALRRIYLVNRPGGHPVPLSPQDTGQFQPTYSPDGRWIAFATWSEVDGGHIWRVASTVGAVPERLTTDAGYYQNPTWSPDGRIVAFVGNEGLSPRSDGLKASPDAGALRLVSLDDKLQRVLPATAQMGRALSFSSDGSSIGFIAYDASNPRKNEVHSIRVSGDDERSAGIEKLLPTNHAGPTVEAILSPDRRMIAIVKFGNLYVMRCTQPVGSGAFAVADCAEMQIANAGAYDPKWSHDGSKLEWSLGNSHYSTTTQSMADADVSLGGANLADRSLPIESSSFELESKRAVASGSIVLKNADIVTMRGDEVIRGGSVLVENGRIVRVEATQIEVPSGAAVIDLGGKTIVPGFIDPHAHFRTTPSDLLSANDGSLLTYLAFGITTAKDPANGGDYLFTYEEMIEAGIAIGPRILSATALVNDGTHKIESYEDALGVADRAAKLGGTFLKYHTGWSRRQRQWIVEAARARRLNAAAHFTNVNYEFARLDLSTVVDGVTSTEHGIPPTVQTSEMAEYIARSGVSINFASAAKNGGYAHRFWDDAQKDQRMLRFYNGWTPRDLDRTAFDPDPHGLPPLSRVSESDVRLAASISKAGGKIAVGSHGDVFGIGFHWEMWAYVHGGMTPHEALKAATINGAYSLGVERDLGSIEVGKVADLLILDKNPLEDIRNTLSVSGVMKHGVLRDARTLDEIWPEVKALPAWRYAEAKSH